MYNNGQGVPQDQPEAFKWYLKAAEQGNALGQNNLGEMYAQGQGTTQDLVQAHMCFNLAAAQGNTKAQENRDELAQQMTPDQISEAERLAAEWKPKGKDR